MPLLTVPVYDMGDLEEICWREAKENNHRWMVQSSFCYEPSECKSNPNAMSAGLGIEYNQLKQKSASHKSRAAIECGQPVYGIIYFLFVVSKKLWQSHVHFTWSGTKQIRCDQSDCQFFGADCSK